MDHFQKLDLRRFRSFKIIKVVRESKAVFELRLSL